MLETNSYAGDLRTRPAIPTWRTTGGAVEANEGETGSANLEKVDHVVVVMLENRSFDHMLGFSGITGTDAVTGAATSVHGLTRAGSSLVQAVNR